MSLTDERKAQLEAQILECIHSGDARRVVTLLRELHGLPAMNEQETQDAVNHLLSIWGLRRLSYAPGKWPE
jgi:hypothetical protein